MTQNIFICVLKKRCDRPDIYLAYLQLTPTVKSQASAHTRYINFFVPYIHCCTEQLVRKAMKLVYLWVLLLVILVLLGVYEYLMTIGDTPASTPLSILPLQHPRNQHPRNSCHCHFLSTREGRIVSLNSLPGSGNTWVRGLLEMQPECAQGPSALTSR